MKHIEETAWFKNQRKMNNGRIPAHLMNATKTTRFGAEHRDMENHKPFRNREGRKYARSVAQKTDQGFWRAFGGFYGVRPAVKGAS